MGREVGPRSGPEKIRVILSYPFKQFCATFVALGDEKDPEPGMLKVIWTVRIGKSKISIKRKSLVEMFTEVGGSVRFDEIEHRAVSLEELGKSVGLDREARGRKV